MLFKFKSKACADLIMLQADGQKILEIMVGQAPAKGIIQVADLPDAFHRLQLAVNEDETKRKSWEDKKAAGEPVEDIQSLATVRLAQRAVPMLKMLQRSMDEEVDVVWGI